MIRLIARARRPRRDVADAARPVGDALAGLSDSASDADLALLAAAVVAVAAAAVVAVAAARSLGVAAGCLVLLGVCSLLALRLAASGREVCRRCADAAAELLDIVDEIGAVVYVRDAGGRYLLVNRQFELLNGVGRDEVLGRRHQDLFPAFATATAGDRKALKQGTPLQAQEVVDQIDGPHTYFTVRHPVTDPNGRAYAVCGISTDITDLMRAEDEVRRLITDLEQRVRERTADLEASTRENDAFTYSVSHDLHAPLRAIAGFSEILLEEYAGQLDPTGREYLGRVHAATGRMARTMDALLDLSYAGRGELEWRPVDLGDLARDTLADLRAAEPDRRVEAVIAGLPVAGDPRLLSLVMQNLVSNAWKFTSEQPAARIAVGMRERRGVPVYYVEDDGTGFDMDFADKLFDPFQRLHAAARFPGAGIGLTIVERVVTRHGGRVWAESAGGRGATIYFTLAPSGTAADDPSDADRG